MSAAPLPAPHQLALVPRGATLQGRVNEVDSIICAIEALDDDELTGEKRDELSAQLIAAIAGTREKVDRATSVLAMWEGLEAACEAEVSRLAKRIAGFARQRERLEGYIIAVMVASELPRMEGNTSAVALRKNPPSVAIEPGAVVPDEYLAEPKPPVIAPDKAAIKKALLSGVEIAGCSLTRTSRLVRS